MIDIFGIGKEGCDDCLQNKGGKPLCTMNCSSRPHDETTCTHCGFPIPDCNERTIARLNAESSLIKIGVSKLAARSIAARQWPDLPSPPGDKEIKL